MVDTLLRVAWFSSEDQNETGLKHSVVGGDSQFGGFWDHKNEETKQTFWELPKAVTFFASLIKVVKNQITAYHGYQYRAGEEALFK